VIGDAHDVHLDAGRNKGDDGMHVRRDAGRCMQRKSRSNTVVISLLGDAMASEESHALRWRWSTSNRLCELAYLPRETHVMEHGAGVEKLVIETQPAPACRVRAPQ